MLLCILAAMLLCILAAAAMMDYYNGTLQLMWKNAPRDEDEPGQRILYSQSADGAVWTPPAVLFPNMSTAANPAAMYVGPTLRVGGLLFAAASPWVSPHGGQFCLWPEPVDPGDAGPPGQKQPVGILMLRQILPGIGKLGRWSIGFCSISFFVWLGHSARSEPFTRWGRTAI
jgi:hypothetical protein